MASVKNFQLIDPEEQNTVVLQVTIYITVNKYTFPSYSSESFVYSCFSAVRSCRQRRLHHGHALAILPAAGAYISFIS
jgi:hypothetical protein